MNCQDIGEILDNGDIGRLDEALLREVAAHNSGCADCARDWALNARFAQLPDIAQPADFAARCRALVTAPRSPGIPRRGRRLVLIGTIVAISAAAAMMSAHRWRLGSAVDARATPDSGVQAADTTLPVVTALAAAPVDDPSSSTVASPLTKVSASLPTAAVRYSVQIMPLQNDAREEAGQAVVASFYQAMLTHLRAIDGLRLVMPDGADAKDGEGAEVQLWISGAGPDEANKFAGRVRARRSGPGAVIWPVRGEFDADCVSSATAPPGCFNADALAASLVDLLHSGFFPQDSASQNPMLARLQDVTLRPDQRLKALQNLAGPSRPTRNGQMIGIQQPANLRDPAIVRAAAELAQTAADPSIRAQVWSRMRGVAHADLLRPLITAAELDEDRAVRIEAIQTLGADFATQPEGAAALEAIAQQDQSPLVRALALRGLKGEQAFNTYIFESLQDAGRSDEERIEAMIYEVHVSADAGRYRQGVLKDLVNFGAIPTLTEVLGRVANTGANRQAVVALMGHLGTLGHPAITDLLLERIEVSRDGEERKVVLAQLARRVADPRVRAALTQVTASEPDPDLRKLAQDALATPPPHTQ